MSFIYGLFCLAVCLNRVFQKWVPGLPPYSFKFTYRALWLASRNPFLLLPRYVKELQFFSGDKFSIFISVSTRAAVNMDHMEVLLHLWCIYVAKLIFSFISSAATQSKSNGISTAVVSHCMKCYTVKTYMYIYKAV